MYGFQKTKKQGFPGLLVGLAMLFAGVPADAVFAQESASANVFPPPKAESPAYARTGTIRVEVAPERSGWTYRAGENVRFKVAVTADRQPLSGAKIRYRVGPEMMPAEEHTAVLPADGQPLVIDGGTMADPGFLRCEVSVTADGRDYRGMATAGLSPDAIRPTQTNPDDFDAFWREGLAELDKVPMQPELAHLPERSTPAVDVYHVGIRTAARGNMRVYGILCVPKGDGPFPAVLQLPGAGIGARSGNMDLAERGTITLQIGIHGIPVNLPEAVYHRLGDMQPFYAHDYAHTHLDSRDRYYYRRVYLSCVRANDFLVSHPKFDGKNLLVMGTSQGGMLAIATAALDPRVKALSAYHPAYCDVTGYLHGRAGGWPFMMRPNQDGSPSVHATEQKIRTTAYYDVVNFARRLKVPGHYSWGYNDPVCAPTAMHAAYNVITAPKQLLLALETGHWATPEQIAAETAWIAEQIGLEGRP